MNSLLKKTGRGGCHLWELMENTDAMVSTFLRSRMLIGVRQACRILLSDDKLECSVMKLFVRKVANKVIAEISRTAISESYDIHDKLTHSCSYINGIGYQCTCGFYFVLLLPCRHIAAIKRSSQGVFTADDIHPQWRTLGENPATMTDLDTSEFAGTLEVFESGEQCTTAHSGTENRERKISDLLKMFQQMVSKVESSDEGLDELRKHLLAFLSRESLPVDGPCQVQIRTAEELPEEPCPVPAESFGETLVEPQRRPHKGRPSLRRSRGTDIRPPTKRSRISYNVKK